MIARDFCSLSQEEMTIIKIIIVLIFHNSEERNHRLSRFNNRSYNKLSNNCNSVLWKWTFKNLNKSDYLKVSKFLIKNQMH